MAVLIDTDLLIDLERGVGSPVVETMLGEEDRAISVITVSELLHGVHGATGARRARRSAFVEHLLAGMRAIPITENTSAPMTYGSALPRWPTGSRSRPGTSPTFNASPACGSSDRRRRPQP